MSRRLLLAVVVSAAGLGAAGTNSCAEAPEPGPEEEAHLHLLLRVTREGSVEVVSASQLAGVPAVSDYAAGDFVVRVKRGEQTLAAYALSDPFAIHGFGGPGEGHPHRGQQASAEVGIRVPAVRLDDPASLEGLSLDLYWARPGNQLTHMDSSILMDLLREDQLEALGSLENPEFSSQIRDAATGN